MTDIRDYPEAYEDGAFREKVIAGLKATKVISPTDLVERLRNTTRFKFDHLEAADEIERLRARLHEVSTLMCVTHDEAQRWKANYLERVDKHNETLNDLAAAEARIAELRKALELIASDYEANDYVGDRECARKALSHTDPLESLAATKGEEC